MAPKTLRYAGVLACGLFALASLAATAGDQKGDKPGLSGTWAKKDGQLKLEFGDKKVLKIVPHGDPAVIVIVCDYTVEKEGVVKAKVTGYEGKEEIKKKVESHVPVGSTFSFHWRVNGNTGQLDGLKGKDVEVFKSHLEGDFEKK